MKENILIFLIVVGIITGMVGYVHAQSANIVAVQYISNTCDNEILNDAAGDQLGPYNSSMLITKLKTDSIKMERDQEAVADDRSHVVAETIGLVSITQCQSSLINQQNNTQTNSWSPAGNDVYPD